jgi:hypothetical protein
LAKFGSKAVAAYQVRGVTNAPTKEVKVVKSLPKPEDVPATSETISRISAACEQAARDRLKDPETARVKDIRRGGVETWCTKPPRAVCYYWMVINAENSYGGYVGEKPYRCATDINETVVLGIAQLGEGEALPASCR